MKHSFRRKIFLGIMLVIALFSLVPASLFAASGNTAYLDLPSGKSQPGDSFSVKIDGHVTDSYVGPFGVGIHTASGSISFPSNLLSVVSYSTSGTTFASSSTITPDNSNGKITFSQSSGTFSAASNQDIHMFTITFKSLAAGTANVTFDSVKYGNGTGSGTITATTTGGTYTISSPSPSPSPSASPSPSPSASPAPTQQSSSSTKVSSPSPSPVLTQTPTVEETADPVSESDGGLKIENVDSITTRTENSISWMVNNPLASSTLQYGTDKNSLKDYGAIALSADGNYKISLADLEIGSLYYYTIKASTDDNLQGATYSGTFTTRGYPVQLTIQLGGLSIPGAKVQIGSRSFVADKNGTVTTEMGAGNFTATITPPGSTQGYDSSFTVKKLTPGSDGEPSLQKFTLNITATGDSSDAPTSSLIPLLVGGAVVTVGLLGGAATLLFIVRKRRLSLAGQAPDIDTAGLSEAYGTDVESHSQYTPEPNLAVGTIYSSQPPAVDTTSAVQPSDVSTPSVAIDNTVPPAASVQVPPAVVDNPLTTQAEATPTTAQNDILDGEIVSQELIQVESSERVASEEPSAVYDAATGELDIIHHHEPHTVTTSPTPAVPTDPTFLQISQDDTTRTAPNPSPHFPTTNTAQGLPT